LAEHATGWWIRGDGAQELSSSLRRDISDSELGDGSVEIAVSHSAVNYKDAMALQGSRGVVRNTPLIPGIDAVGRVLSSGDPTLTPGETVILTGWGYGERRHGGLATRMRADPEHLIVLPEGLSPHQAATLGTAGFTAGLAVARLRAAGVSPRFFRFADCRHRCRWCRRFLCGVPAGKSWVSRHRHYRSDGRSLVPSRARGERRGFKAREFSPTPAKPLVLKSTPG